MMQYLLFPVLRHGVLLLLVAWLALGYYYRAEIFSKTAWEASGPAEAGSVAETPGEAGGRSGEIPARSTTAPETDAAVFTDTAKAKSDEPTGERQVDGAPGAVKPTSVPAFMRVLRPTEPEAPPAWKTPVPVAAKRAPIPTTPPPAKTRPVEPTAPPNTQPPELLKAPEDTTSHQPPVAAAAKQAAPAPAIPSRQDGDSEQVWLARARKAYWEGKKDAAVAYYRQGLARFPQSADLIGELGNIAFEEGRYTEAIDYLTQAEQRLRSAGRDAEAGNLVSIIALIKRKIAEKQAAAK